MKPERLIEILAEEMAKNEMSGGDKDFWVADIKKAVSVESDNNHTFTQTLLTAMTRAVEEETKKLNTTISALNRFRIEDAASALNEQNRLRAEITRLRECEAIVRELAGTDFSDDLSMQDIRDLARQWVQENPE